MSAAGLADCAKAGEMNMSEAVLDDRGEGLAG